MAQSRFAGRCAAGWRSRCTQAAARRPPASFGRSRRSWRPADARARPPTVKEIAAQTGMSVQTVRRRLRLRSLTPALRAAFDHGRITASVAEAAARLPEPEQRAACRRSSPNEAG